MPVPRRRSHRRPRRKALGKTVPLYQELEQLADRLGFSVIIDSGHFKGGACVMEGEDMIILNGGAPLEQRLQHLVEAVATRDLSDIYLKPAVRELLDRYQPVGPS